MDISYVINNSFAAIFRAVPLPCVVLLPNAPNFTIAFINQAYCDATNCCEEELLHKSVFEAFPENPDDAHLLSAEKFRLSIESIISSKKAHKMDIQKYDIPIRGTSDYIVKYWNPENTPILNEMGEVAYILHCVTDVTDQILAEEKEKASRLELFKKEEESFLNKQRADLESLEKHRIKKAFKVEQQRFRELYTQAPSCMGVLKGPNYVFEMANPPYLQLIGKKNIIGKTVREVLPEMEAQGIFNILDEVFTSGKTFSANEMLVKFDLQDTGNLNDRYLNFIYQAHRNDSGDIDGILFFANDVTEQVLLRRRIEESEKKYRQIVETAQEGIWIIDENEKIILVNNKMCQILGYTYEEVIGKDIYYFKDDEAKKQAFESIEKRKAGFSDQNQFKFTSKTGQDIWTHISANPLFNQEGVYEGSLAMITDITEIKKAELKLKASNERFINVTKATFDAVWDWDIETNQLYLGDGFKSIFGYEVTNNMGDITKFQQNIHADDRQAVLKSVQKVIRDSNTNNWKQQYRYIKADGEIAHVIDRGLVLRDKAGKAYRMVGAMHDISIRKKNQVALQQSESRLKGIIASQTNYVIRTDLDGNYTYCNEKFLSDFGWIHQDSGAVGESGMQSIMEYDHPKVVDTIRKCMGSMNTVFQIEIDKPAKTGGVKTTFWDFICLTDSTGLPMEIQCVGIDISRKKKVEVALIHSLEEKKVILESIGDAFFAIDKNWKVTYWNHQAEKLLNTPKASIINKNFWNVFTDSIGSISYLKFHQAIEKSEVSHFEDLYPALSKWFEISCYPSNRGLSVYFKDVSERKRQEAALNLSEQRFKALVQEGSDLISILDANMQYMYLSPAYTNILGINLKDLIGSSALERIHQEDRETVLQTSALLLTDRRVQFLPFRYKISENKYRWIESVATNLLDDPAVEGILFNSKDVTERINYIQAIEEQNNKLKDIAWTQSHIVRAPLSRIMGLVDLITNYSLPEKERSEMLSHLLTSANELDSIIRDIVKNTEMSKIQHS